jgi:serine/threonine protein kinase
MTVYPSVPGYILLRELGGGPLAHVFVARPADLDAEVAVKRLRDDVADDPTSINLFRREARAALAVKHPHLVRTFDAHVLSRPMFIVMELLPGESLRQRLRRDYRLNLLTALWIARQATEALAAVHRAGFIHGDVKPENVHLADSGRAVLVDLGFAHRPGENAALFRQGYLLGTANYLAPELCGPDPNADVSSDLFALGVMIFEMLTGQLPYPQGTIPETMASHRDNEPAQLGHGWPPALAELVRRLMARRPAERPRAARVVQELVRLEIAAMGRPGAISSCRPRYPRAS